MTSPLFRTRPATDAEREAIRLIGDTPFVANVTIAATAVSSPRSILAGPGVRFDQEVETGEIGEAITPPGDLYAALPPPDTMRYLGGRQRCSPLLAGDDAKRLFLVLSFLAAVAIVALALAGAARAHGIYTSWRDPASGALCCNGEDCAPFPEERVKVLATGYLIAAPGRAPELIPFARTIPSPDGRYHRCTQEWDAPEQGLATGDTRCFAAPMPGS